MCCILQLYNQYSFASSHLLTTVSRYVEFYCEPYCVGVVVGLSRVANDKREDMIPRSRWYRDIRVSRRDETETLEWRYWDKTKTFKSVSRLTHSRRRLQPWFLVTLFHCSSSLLCKCVLCISSSLWCLCYSLILCRVLQVHVMLQIEQELTPDNEMDSNG